MTTNHTAGPVQTVTPHSAAASRGLGRLYVVAGALGLVSSFALIVEKLQKLANPGYVPTCSINPIVSCGSVMDSAQAEVFGFPNPLIGVAAFAVLVTAGAVLMAGLPPPRWFWLGLQLGTTFGVGLVHWLIYQSIYEIGALCPYCMVVWLVTIPAFWYTSLHNLERGHLAFPGGRAFGARLARYHTAFLAAWYLAIAGLALQRFWSYFG